jgi:hypothetical protein
MQPEVEVAATSVVGVEVLLDLAGQVPVDLVL